MRLALGSPQVLRLKEEVCGDNHAANPSAELLRLQERWIRRQHVSLGRQRGGYAAIAEHIAIAQCVVRMIEDVENLSLYLEILGLSDVEVPAERHIPCVETGGPVAVAAHCCKCSTASDDILGRPIYWCVANRGIETETAGRCWIDRTPVKRSRSECLRADIGLAYRHPRGASSC